MPTRSIASLTLSFGLVSIPVRLYSATESSSSVRFNLLAKDGSRLKQQYISEKDHEVVSRAEMVKGYEFEKDQFVIFTPAELKALEESSRPTIDIVAFIPDTAIDPVFYDKPYLLAPDKRGGKPYALLAEAMRKSGRTALAKWAWRAKEYTVQVRPTPDGLILQQLLYAEEVRSLKDLHIEKVDVSAAELQLALQLIEQVAQDTFDPAAYEDEEKKRVLAAIDEKISGRQIVAAAPNESPAGAQVIDLMEALKASLGKNRPATASSLSRPVPAKAAEPKVEPSGQQKKGSVVAMKQPKGTEKEVIKEVAKKSTNLPTKDRKGARRSTAPAHAEDTAPRSRARK